jgi:hypothetical protein
MLSVRATKTRKPMAVFISYSHEDSAFVDTLVSHLVASKTHVWIDKWEIHVGDSLLRKIEQAIQDSDALVAVLSRASVQSEWCRKELTAGLVRELEERHVLVLPVLVEDCEVPLFLRDKKYADFRRHFDQGLRDIREAVARVSTAAQGRTDEPRGYIDWSLAWSICERGAVTVHIVAAEHPRDQPYTILTTLDIALNEVASRRHVELAGAGFEEFGKRLILSAIADVPEFADLSVLLVDERPVTRKFRVRDSKAGLEYDVTATSRWLGQATGRDVLLHVGRQAQQMATQGMRTLQPAPVDRRDEFLAIMKRYRPDLPFNGAP